MAHRTVRQEDDPRWHQATDVSSLARDSSAVIVGVPQQNACRLSANDRGVTTEYRVIVVEAIKGGVRAGDNVAVNLPGGLARLEDGSFLKVRTPSFRKMVDGRRYVLFLTEAEASGGSYVTTAGPQGLYELTPGEKVRHYGRPFYLSPDDPQAPNADAFLKEVRRAAR